jgi:hypothetical protein
MKPFFFDLSLSPEMPILTVLQRWGYLVFGAHPARVPIRLNLFLVLRGGAACSRWL